MFCIRSINRFILTSLALLGLSISSVNGAIVGFIDNGSYTTDTFSGLDWLDSTASTDRSFNDVSSHFGVGGDFEGWRYASTAEVTTFWDNAGGTAPYNGLIGNSETWIPDLQSLWGVTTVPPSIDLRDWTNVQTGTLSAPGTHWISALGDHRANPFHPEVVFFAKIFVQEWPNDWGVEAIGSALVRTALNPVPVPAAVWLFSTALIGFVGFGKRRKAA
jgi:hypothetical protein